MSKISTYEVAPVPKLSDKLIGTSVGGEIEDITYNFTLLELLELFLPVIPANNLQGILDYGNTATQDINLFGTITTTNLSVTDTANLFITYLNEETHIVGTLFDSVDSVGTAGQVLTSTVDGVEWYTLPPIFTPNLQQVLTEGNTADIDILLDANIEALDVSSDTATVSNNLTLDGTITDGAASVGAAGQVLSSSVTGVQWTDLPVYSATSPLLYDSGSKTFSIQVANGTQGGYLTANDWVTFDGKQNAGPYITALTGEATASGPGSVPITLNNASVVAKVLTGLNITGGSISASDSILTAFGKVQSQINGLMGGVQYQGVWDAATNNPVLTSSIGVQGHYYIVNVAGSTNLNGITDWKVGDWAIYSGGSWQKVDNTESVTSVNGQTGAVSLTTDNVPEGAVNLYYLNSRARAALSFSAGSGAYNNLTGVITIPTDNSQILNGAQYITLASLSAAGPLAYSNLTGVFSIQQASVLQDGYLSAIDWAIFNGKQNYLGGTGLVKSTSGTITYITDNSSNWNTAYDNMIVSAAVTGTSTKTLTLNQQDGGTIQASWTDLDTGLTSVGVTMPSAFSVANSPLTSNGTIGITGAGTSLQYIDGTGALQTFPGLTGFVPYLGANQNVDLGEYGISAGYFQADLTPTGALQVGRMQWNAVEGTMDLRLMGNNVTLQVGQENVTRVVNKSGIDLLEANYQVVRVRKVAEGGAQGQRLAVVLAQGNNENNSTEVLGLVTETILVNQEGFITAFGEVKQINTTGSLQGETWVDGDILYISTTVPGQLTNIRPVAPNHAVTVGYVTYAHANNGKIYMAIDTGYELGELHNVYAPSPLNNQSIYWNTANSRYELNTVGGILGYTPADAALTIATTAPLQGGGNLTANRTFSITQAGAASDGYLSSADWNTFNNKQPAGSYVPTSRLLSINGTQYDLSADRSWSVGTVTSVAALTLGTSGTDLSSTVANGTTTPVITLNVPTASAANRGALSAADWSTFNTKVGGVTASSPLASSGGQTPNITIQQASGSQDGYLSSTDWTTFNNKQSAGNYITSLTGEATASGPGAAAVTLNNASVTSKVLTGVNITGGTVLATDTMLTAFGKLQNQINGLVGGSIYQGTWNASTNTPALASGVGTKGYYYIVSVSGTTNLDGITDWFIGDWAIFDGTAWQQVDNTDAVVSVNGQTGAVSLTTDNISEGTTNLYFTPERARASLSFAAGSGAYNSSTGVITIPTNTSQLTNGALFITLASLSGVAPIQYNNGTGAISITQAGTASNGYLSSTDWNTFNNKAPSVAGGYLALSGGVMTGQIVLKESSSSADYTKGLKFPNDAFGGGGDVSGLRLYSSSGENIVLELYVGNDSGSDKINFATGVGGTANNDDVTINGNKIWNAGNLPTPQTAISLTTTGDSGASTFTSNVLNIPAYTLSGLGGVPTSGYTFGTSFNLGTMFVTTGTQFTPTELLGVYSNGYAYKFSLAGVQSWLGLGGYLPLTGGVMTGNIKYGTATGADWFIESNACYNGPWIRFRQNTAAAGFANRSGALGFIDGTCARTTVLQWDNSAMQIYVPLTATSATLTGLLTGTSININGTLTLTGANSGSIVFYSLYSGDPASPGFVITNQAGTVTMSHNSNGGATTVGGTLTLVNGELQSSSTLKLASNSTTIYLRPNGANTSTGQVSIESTGVATFSSSIRVNGASDATSASIISNGGLVIYGGAITNAPTAASVVLDQQTGGVARLMASGSSTWSATLAINPYGGVVGFGTTAAKVKVHVLGLAGGQAGAGEYAGDGNYYGGGRAAIYQSYYGDEYGNGAPYSATSGTKPPYSVWYGGGAGGYFRGGNGDPSPGGGGAGIVAIGGNGSTYAGGGAPYAEGGAGIYARGGFNRDGVTRTWAGYFEGAVFIRATDVSGNRISPFNVLTISAENPNAPYNAFGGSILFNNRSYTHGVVSSSRIRSVIYDDGSNQGGGFIFETTPTAGGALTNSFELSYTGAAVFASSVTSNTFLSAPSFYNGLSYPYNTLFGSGADVTNTKIRAGSTTGYESYVSMGSNIIRIGTASVERVYLSQTFMDIYTQLYVYGNTYISAANNTIGNDGGAQKKFVTIGLNGADYQHRYIILCKVPTFGAATVNCGFRGTIVMERVNGIGIDLHDDFDLTVSYNNEILFRQTSYQSFRTSLVQISYGGVQYLALYAYSAPGWSVAYIDAIQTNYGGWLDSNTFVAVQSGSALHSSIGYGSNTTTFNQAVTSSGNITANAFFESSDSRLKELISDNYLPYGIDSIKPKLYRKNGKQEVGYFAQDFQGLLPSAISVNEDGLLSLSYTQVHTAKIAIIEDEVTVLKRRVAELESKLN